ncbi:universal stress protein [Nocardioides cynanchi]|uniref:universal stress protein n=1 Tax=Nocardioides cynanchi TaxID=2558918 RepID=UPI001245A911|nr:universal stress protein [Nocardioides cynanchi]
MTSNDGLAAGTIVVGVDGSPSSSEAVAWAARQAVLDHRPLTLLHAYHLENAAWVAQAGLDQSVILQSLKDSGTTVLGRARLAARAIAPDLEVDEYIVRADPRDALSLASKTAAMVVVGSRGHGRVASLLLGSVGLSLARHGCCPVVVLRPHGAETRHGVLTGTDGTDDTLPALQFAYGLAASRHLPLTVLTFGPGFPWFGDAATDAASLEMQEQVQRWLAELGEKYPEVGVSVRHVEDPEAEALVATATLMDAVVVGSHHEGMLASALGRALAVAVVEHAPTTVVVVPDAPVA